MGIKEIFRKEEKFLGNSKELPELASESLSDDTSENNFVKNTPQEQISNPLKEQLSVNIPENTSVNNVSSQQYSQNHSFPQTPSQGVPQPFMYHTPMNSPINSMSYPQGMPYHYIPQFFPQQMISYPPNNSINTFNHDLSMDNSSERGPLKKLLLELDNLESRWHILSNKKSSLEKELKYLETEIEHKMHLLRSHLAIANESNSVKEGDEFFLADGQILSSRKDLEVAATQMSKQIFDHHVGPGWNDFEVWVANCLHDYSLAKKLKLVKNIDELIIALKKY